MNVFKVVSKLGFAKMLPGEILEKTAQRLGKLSGGKVGKIWEMSEAEWLAKVKAGETGIEFKEMEALTSELNLRTLAPLMQKEAVGGGAIKPGLQLLHAEATGELGERAFFAFNTVKGETIGFASMTRNAQGEWVRGGLTVAESMRGGGTRGLGHRLSREMFEHGALVPSSLSTSGAKAYYRQVVAIRDEVLAMENLTRAQSEFTVPGVASSLRKERGIRRGPNGGNG
jgi:hypothetical protein